jgi:ribosomal protein L3 glutamine methyltransferase
VRILAKNFRSRNPFIPMTESSLRTIRDLVRWGASAFGRAGLHFGHGTDNALDEAFHLVTWALKLPHDLPTAYLDAVLTAGERKQVLKLLRKRMRTRKPAAYLTGEAWFAGLAFAVDERVLVPRSPIAELVEHRFQPWLREPPRRILDLCAGCGCIAVACAAAFPGARVDAAELDAGAFELLERNIARHELQGRVEAVRSDLFDRLKGRRYDLIVSNPPYVPSATRGSCRYSGGIASTRALDAGGDGMDVVARILRDAPRHLEREGLLVCEVGGSVPEFNRRFPKIPVVWPDFERGGDGVFVISRDDLEEWRGEP